MHTKDHVCLCCPWKCMEQCILKAISLQCLSTLNPLIQLCVHTHTHTHTHTQHASSMWFYCEVSTPEHAALPAQPPLPLPTLRQPGGQLLWRWLRGRRRWGQGGEVWRYEGSGRGFEKEGGSFSKLLFFPQKVCISLIQEGSSCVYSTCCLSWPLIAPVVHGVMWLIRTIHTWSTPQ